MISKREDCLSTTFLSIYVSTADRVEERVGRIDFPSAGAFSQSRLSEGNPSVTPCKC